MTMFQYEELNIILSRSYSDLKFNFTFHDRCP